MAISDHVFDVLLILLWIATPLVFAISLLFQDSNRRTPMSFKLTSGIDSKTYLKNMAASSKYDESADKHADRGQDGRLADHQVR